MTQDSRIHSNDDKRRRRRWALIVEREDFESPQRAEDLRDNGSLLWVSLALTVLGIVVTVLVGLLL